MTRDVVALLPAAPDVHDVAAALLAARERFGVRWTVLVMLALLVANGGVTVSEFVGIAAATELFGVPRFVSVPAHTSARVRA